MAYCHSNPFVKVFFHSKKVYSCWLVQDRRVSPAGGGSSGSAAQDSPPHLTRSNCGLPQPATTARVTYGPRVREMEPCAAFTRRRGGRAGSTRWWRPRRLPGTRSAPWHGTTRQPLVTSTQECQFSPGPQISPRSSPAGRVRGPAGPTRQRTSSRGSRPPAGSGQAEAAALDLHERPPSIKHSPGSLGGLREG